MKKIISVLVAILMLASLFTFCVSAANNSIIAFSSNTVTVGDKVTVTITLNSNTPIYAYQFKLHYDAEKLSIGDSAGVIAVADVASGEKTKSFSYTFTSTAVGSALIRTSDCVISSDGTTETVLANASANLTIKDVALSNNANLKSLSLSKGTLSPAFNANRTSYTATVTNDVTTLNVYANTSDAKAKITLNKPAALNVGKNTIEVVVTAQNGGQKVYKIVVTRLEQGEDITSQPETSTPDNTNPLETVVSGKSFEIVTQIPEANIFKGFSLTTADFNGTQVPVIKDKTGEFTVYFLKESGSTEIAPYTYNAELETFEALKFKVFNEIVYIFTDFPEGVSMPDDYYSSFAQIGNYSVKAYISTDSQMSDFAYVYCFVDGEKGLYRYDTKEGTIQRFPDIHLVDAPMVSAPVKDNFATRFSSLSTNGKVLLIAMLVAALCVVILIIFLIIMAFKKLFNNENNLEYDDDFDFDDVIVVGENDDSKK